MFKLKKLDSMVKEMRNLMRDQNNSLYSNNKILLKVAYPRVIVCPKDNKICISFYFGDRIIIVELCKRDSLESGIIENPRILAFFDDREERIVDEFLYKKISEKLENPFRYFREILMESYEILKAFKDFFEYCSEYNDSK